MLGHQLGFLPAFDDHWDSLEGFFDWLVQDNEDQQLIELQSVSDKEKWEPPPIEWKPGQSEKLEPIRFAAVNRLCLSLGYKDDFREVEPYSLRRTQAGKILFFGRRQPEDAIRAYRIDRIQSIAVLPKPFTPKSPIEFTPNGRFSAPLLRRKARVGFGPYLRSPYSGTGKKYIIQCPYCHRTFLRKTRDLQLRSHIEPNSQYKCLGSNKRGYLIETKYN